MELKIQSVSSVHLLANQSVTDRETDPLELRLWTAIDHFNIVFPDSRNNGTLFSVSTSKCPRQEVKLEMIVLINFSSLWSIMYQHDSKLPTAGVDKCVRICSEFQENN
jgi:hypothetical protein